MEQQTAVDWLKVMLEWNYGDSQMLKISWANLDDLLQRAKQMEKEQIMKSVYDGMGTNFDPNMGRAEQYYIETYGE